MITLKPGAKIARAQKVMEELEEEIKRRGLYGLERMGRVAKSGNSLARTR